MLVASVLVIPWTRWRLQRARTLDRPPALVARLTWATRASVLLCAVVVVRLLTGNYG
jgi:hypothetical protein